MPLLRKNSKSKSGVGGERNPLVEKKHQTWHSFLLCHQKGETHGKNNSGVISARGLRRAIQTSYPSAVRRRRRLMNKWSSQKRREPHRRASISARVVTAEVPAPAQCDHISAPSLLRDVSGTDSAPQCSRLRWRRWSRYVRMKSLSKDDYVCRFCVWREYKADLSNANPQAHVTTWHRSKYDCLFHHCCCSYTKRS